jgi:hypothetical protein
MALKLKKTFYLVSYMLHQIIWKVSLECRFIYEIERQKLGLNVRYILQQGYQAS